MTLGILNRKGRMGGWWNWTLGKSRKDRKRTWTRRELSTHNNGYKPCLIVSPFLVTLKETKKRQTGTVHIRDLCVKIGRYSKICV